MKTIQIIMDDVFYHAELISYEGELMEISMRETFNARPGLFVACLYLDKYVDARIIGHNNSKIYLFVPPFSFDLYNERRNQPRLDFAISALLINETETLDISIVDFNSCGFGFLCAEEIDYSEDSYHLIIEMNIFSVAPRVLITNSVPQTTGYRYGSQIQYIKQDELAKLRNFCMFCRCLQAQ